MRNELEFPLGLADLDDAHRQLLEELAGMAESGDLEFARCYPALVAAIEREFRSEEILMDDIGLESFPAHLEQHARMLSALHHMAPRVQEGDVACGREAVALLGQWLLTHFSTMDRLLAVAVLQKGERMQA